MDTKTQFLPHLKNCSKEIFSAFVLAFTLFFFAPLSVYIKNAKSLEFNLSDVWLLYLIISMIVFLILALASLLIKRMFRYIAVLLAALSICFIVQGNFLSYDLGMLDGKPIPWETFRVQSVFEILLWGIIIGVSYYFRKVLYKNISMILVMLIVYQVGSNVISIISNPLPDNDQKVYINYENEFEFSKSGNVLLIVLDSFRSDAFEQILVDYPEYQTVFKDFTFYPDAVGGFPMTHPSIPLIITGQYYDNSMRFDEFVDQSQSKAFPIVLKKSGYLIENYSDYPYYTSIYDNTSTSLPPSERNGLILKQYFVSGIRYMPLLIKPFFVNQYYEGVSYYHKDMVDFEKRAGKTNASIDQPVFKFIHLSGAHDPFQLDAEMNRADEGYIQQAVASLKIMSDLFYELRENGIYDDSLIIIIGDHGRKSMKDHDGTFLMSIANPLLLTKQKDQQFDVMQYSGTKVALADLPKSILDIVGIQNNYAGYSIFEPIPDDRVRLFYFFGWTNSYDKNEFTPPIYIFNVLGPARQRSSYRLTEILTSDDNNKRTDLYYQYGNDIVESFLSDVYHRLVWSVNFSFEKNDSGMWSWASGPEACIYLPVESFSSDLDLSMTAEPYLADGQIDNQRMTVTVNSIPILTTNDGDKIEGEIPLEVLQTSELNNQINLCFQFPDATKSPVDYNLSEKDDRLLGFKFTSIVLAEK